MKRIGIAVLVAVAAVVAFSSIASAEEIIPIEDFEVVEDFPSQIIAGSTYDAHYRFNCTANESTPVAMYFGIGGPEIGLEEWFVSATVNELEISVLENYENAGNFTLSYEMAAGSTNDVIIQISSLPNVWPDAYTFTLELWSEIVEVIPPEPEPEELPPEVEDELPPEVPPEDIPPEKPPESPPPAGGGARETDALSSGQIQRAAFVGAIGVLGIIAMFWVMVWRKRRRRKGGIKK